MHSGVSKKTNVDEECDKLLEERACRYFNNMPKLLGLQNSSVLQVTTTMLRVCWEPEGHLATNKLRVFQYKCGIFTSPEVGSTPRPAQMSI